jgi:CheY-like chemotaxis protein
MASAAATFDIILSLDDAPRWLEAARRALHLIRDELGASLTATDILYLDPSLLLCLLHFDASTHSPAMTARVAILAQGGHFRVLRPMLLNAEERRRFYSERLERMSFRETGVTDIDPVFDVLAMRVAGRTVATVAATHPSSELRFTLQFANEERFLQAYQALDDSEVGGLFISCGALPNVGAAVKLSLRLDSGQGPLDLQSRVVWVRSQEEAQRQGSAPGFAVGFVVSPDERGFFESFLNAVRRHAPWPDEQGRRHERFAVRLPLEYHDGEGLRSGYTVNLSLGGLFLAVDPLPPLGARLTMHLYAAGRTRLTPLLGEVVHLSTPMQAAARGLVPGVGVRFLEPAGAVQEKLERILGSVVAPCSRRALVVDDDRFFRVVLGNVLKLAGFDVLEASDGNEALVTLLDASCTLDLLTVDLAMPGMSGQELIRLVRRLRGERSVPTVVITSTSLSDAERGALESDDVLPKDLAAEEIVRRVEQVLQRHALATPPPSPPAP